MDALGIIQNPPSIKSTLNSKVVGVICMNAENLLDPTAYPLNTPFISFSLKNNLINILNISGLQANSQYRLTLLLIGN